MDNATPQGSTYLRGNSVQTVGASSLKGDPADWMRRYFDAHVYVANWCTCLLYLRVPKSTFDAETFRAFKTRIVFSVDQTKTHWLLEWRLDESDNYDRFAEEDGRGWMGRLVPLRDELLRGDMRPLYLGWLAGVSAGEVDEKAIEPQPPLGLSRLTAAQQSLVEFLEVDEDLLAAAGLSDQQGSKPDSESDAERDAWITALPVAEKTAILKLLLTGNAQQAERKLKLLFLAWQREQQTTEKPGTRRTVAELQKLAASAAEARKRQEAVQHKRAEAEQQARRETYLRAGCRLRSVLAGCRRTGRTWHRFGLRQSQARTRGFVRSLCALRGPS